MKSTLTLLIAVCLASLVDAQNFKIRKDIFYVDDQPYLTIKNTGNFLEKRFNVTTMDGTKILDLKPVNADQEDSYYVATLHPSLNEVNFPFELGTAYTIGETLFKLNILVNNRLSHSGELAFIIRFNNGAIGPVHRERMSKVDYPDKPSSSTPQQTTTRREMPVSTTEAPPYEIKFDGRLTIIRSVNTKGSVSVNDEELFKVDDGATVVGKPFVLKNTGQFSLYQLLKPIDDSKPFYMVYRLDKVTYDPEHWEYIYSDTLNQWSTTVMPFGPLEERGYFGRPSLNIVDPREAEAPAEILKEAWYHIYANRSDNVTYAVYINDKDIYMPEDGTISQHLMNYLKPGKNALKVVMTPVRPGKEYVVQLAINRTLKFGPDDKTDHPYVAVEYREKEQQTKELTFYLQYYNRNAKQ